MVYVRPNLTKELLCTYRNPMDAAYALNEGLTSEGTVIVRTTAKQKLYDSVPHVTVAITRNTVSCVYYTDNGEDAVDRFVNRALPANDEKIYYNAKMAIRNRDRKVMDVFGRPARQNPRL
ncbi:hypothetical protein EVAR_69549_1 [Eumeta japonica]|uniref:Uncharacterized protein n=1 Tax=Eumeta variegata TaxID=151549 RepID=A0A4C2A4B6_EUMVA|nr:hypothetical protein EVAR_69549_1 [Eumeta japonica]